jgi:hypothetical protein
MPLYQARPAVSRAKVIPKPDPFPQTTADGVDVYFQTFHLYIYHLFARLLSESIPPVFQLHSFPFCRRSLEIVLTTGFANYYQLKYNKHTEDMRLDL